MVPTQYLPPPTNLFELKAHIGALERIIEFYTKLYQDEEGRHYKDEYIKSRLDFLFGQYMVAKSMLSELVSKPD